MIRNRLLVVDDHKFQRELYTLILEDAGYEVTAARSGEEALSLAREDHFDLVLADDKTTGTDGVMLLIDLIRQNPSIFVVMIITGSEKILTRGSVQAIREALRGGRFHFLEKPADLKELLDTVGAAISRSQRTCDHRSAN